ncbi:MAG: hypothetical protein H6636_14470 [Anaerolineales bacterium]|nr:hypothetical protein [Anaerolineales bacterium]
MFFQAFKQGANAVLTTIGSGAAAGASQLTGTFPRAVLAYYAWDLLWVGLFVVLVAVILNWKNSPLGYWLNLAVVSAVDGRLLTLLVVPGYMAWADGLGVKLWIPAVLFSTIGLLKSPTYPKQQTPLVALD